MRYSTALSLAVVLTIGGLLSAHASDRCVTEHHTTGCYDSISAAVAAAQPGDTILVGPGTYRESVAVPKSLSLVGDGATVNAQGLSRGFYVDGLDNAGLNGVHITGFTIKNADLEGVLVANASGVTIAYNTVLDNNQALVNGMCTAQPVYEPGETQDCGEGIHLMGADHSIVSGNTLHGNAGGILVSDDTGLTHDNLISFNTVTDNPYACGITLASHDSYPTTTPNNSFGVFHNTVYANHARHNGYSAGGGAGVGIFASDFGAKSYGNVVVANLVNDNGHPGISLHGHAPNQLFTDNMIVGNTIENNGADTSDAATPGPTGVNVYSLLSATGDIISGNSVSHESYDVVVHQPAPVMVELNNLPGKLYGVDGILGSPVDATNNYWGCIEGPLLAGQCSTAIGTGVVDVPWLPLPVATGIPVP